MAASLWAAPPAICEPCYCDSCNGVEKLNGISCLRCGEKLFGCRELTCVNCHEFPVFRELDLADLAYIVNGPPRSGPGHDESCGGRRDTATGLCPCETLRKMRYIHQPTLESLRAEYEDVSYEALQLQKDLSRYKSEFKHSRDAEDRANLEILIDSTYEEVMALRDRYYELEDMIAAAEACERDKS
jgi:hypothetical protein